MTDSPDSFIDRISDSRRSFMKRTAAATGGLVGLTGMGAAVTTQADPDDADAAGGEVDEVDAFGEEDNIGDDAWFDEDNASEALMYREAWVPNGVFTIASPVIDFEPDAPGVADNLLGSFNTRVVRYIGTGTNVLFFPEDGATIGPFEENVGFVVDEEFAENDEVVVGGNPIGDQGGVDDQELKQLRPTIFIYQHDNDFVDSGDERVIKVKYSPIPDKEEERLFDQVKDEFPPVANQSG